MVPGEGGVESAVGRKIGRLLLDVFCVSSSHVGNTFIILVPVLSAASDMIDGSSLLFGVYFIEEVMGLVFRRDVAFTFSYRFSFICVLLAVSQSCTVLVSYTWKKGCLFTQVCENFNCQYIYL